MLIDEKIPEGYMQYIHIHTPPHTHFHKVRKQFKLINILFMCVSMCVICDFKNYFLKDKRLVNDSFSISVTYKRVRDERKQDRDALHGLLLTFSNLVLGSQLLEVLNERLKE